jgi:hypothetical protein
MRREAITLTIAMAIASMLMAVFDQAQQQQQAPSLAAKFQVEQKK